MNKIWGKLFRRRRQDKSAPSANIATRAKLEETLTLLEKKDGVIQGKIKIELEKARLFMTQNKRKQAMQCLKKKKMWEAQAENISNYQLRLHDQIIMLENANATTDVIGVLREGAQVMKTIQKQNNIDDVERTMDGLRDQAENFHQIQQSLAAPGLADIDEDDLERELQELQELEDDLATLNSDAPSHNQPQHSANIPVQAASLARVSPQSESPSGMRRPSHSPITLAPPGKPPPTAEEEELIADMAPHPPPMQAESAVMAPTPPMQAEAAVMRMT